MLQIKGLQKLSLIDYPGKVCSVVFLAGCNFRCPFCQNPELVLNSESLKTIPPEEVLAFLNTRKGWIDGVVVTGGEPTIYPELPDFIKQIKALGFHVKLDTNGTNPVMLEQLIKDKAIDYIAMDIKGSLDEYHRIANARVDVENIDRSVQIIRGSGLDYEFRSTVLPAFHTEHEMIEIGKWLKGSNKFAIQQFSPEETLDPSFKEQKSFKKDELERFKAILTPYFKTIEIRM